MKVRDKILKISVIALASAAFAACVHKPLYFPSRQMADVEVIYDWRLAPSASPAGMELIAFPANTGLDEDADADVATSPWIFHLPKTGGNISLPEGSYNLLSFNHDTDGILFHDTNDFFRFEIYTRSAGLLDGFERDYKGKMPLRSVEERVVLAPDKMWSVVETENISVEKPLPLTLYPSLLTPDYTVVIKNVSGLKGASLAGASLSGLSSSIRLCDTLRSEDVATMPFRLAISQESGELRGSFNSFGLPADPRSPNMLEVYVRLRDGRQLSYIFNVTEQVRHAPDSMNVYIEAEGIDLPEPDGTPGEGEGGGIGVEVDDWETIEIPVKPYQ